MDTENDKPGDKKSPRRAKGGKKKKPKNAAKPSNPKGKVLTETNNSQPSQTDTQPTTSTKTSSDNHHGAIVESVSPVTTTIVPPLVQPDPHSPILTTFTKALIILILLHFSIILLFDLALQRAINPSSATFFVVLLSVMCGLLSASMSGPMITYLVIPLGKNGKLVVQAGFGLAVFVFVMVIIPILFSTAIPPRFAQQTIPIYPPTRNLDKKMPSAANQAQFRLADQLQNWKCAIGGRIRSGGATLLALRSNFGMSYQPIQAKIVLHDKCGTSISNVAALEEGIAFAVSGEYDRIDRQMAFTINDVGDGNNNPDNDNDLQIDTLRPGTEVIMIVGIRPRPGYEKDFNLFFMADESEIAKYVSVVLQ